LNLLKDPKTEEHTIFSLIDPKFSVQKHISGMFDIDDNGMILIDGISIPQGISDRIVAGVKLGEPINHIIRLWNNIMDNPDPRTRRDLYAYLVHNEHPITPDGCFIAYRGVKKLPDGRLVDKNTGKFDNSPGKTVTMKREDCDSNPNVTCSRGLHGASWTYAYNTYGGDVIINIKVNPKDVVAFPVDYHERKFRCCQFCVLEINNEERPLTGLTHHDGSILYNDDKAFDTETPTVTNFDLQKDINEGIELKKLDTKENWKKQLRDSMGRFIKQKELA
jgi:hypothetical protein